MIREIIILSILGVLVICAFFWTRRDAKKEKLAFLGFTVLLFTIIYCVSILGYKIGGPVDISKVEKAKKEVYAAKEDILEMTKDIIKIAYILADGAGRWNGMPKEHLEEINKIKNQLFKNSLFL